MTSIQIQFLGSGDAFGSGARFQTCILVRGALGNMLIDCGASSLIAMKRSGIDPTEIGCVALSHLHGDHFGGIPFMILDGQFSRRERPLIVAGPPTVRERVEVSMEAFFPGSSKAARRFSVNFVELEDGKAGPVGPARVTPFAVEHASGAPAFALRVEYGDKVVAYSGDAAWTEALIDASRGADLFICEAYFFEKKVPYHLDYETLAVNRQRLDCRRIVLTHMSADMLARSAEVALECAEDGLTIEL